MQSEISLRQPKNRPPARQNFNFNAPQLRRPVVNGAELADVLEVGPNTTPSAAKSQLDRLKQAYGLLYSNSAQRSKNRFGNLFRNAPHNPIFGNSGGGLDYDYVDEFDQQGPDSIENLNMSFGLKNSLRFRFDYETWVGSQNFTFYCFQ